MKASGEEELETLNLFKLGGDCGGKLGRHEHTLTPIVSIAQAESLSLSYQDHTLSGTSASNRNRLP